MTTTRYVSRPVEVDAVQWTGEREDIPAEWLTNEFVRLDEFGKLIVSTPHGAAVARLGDYIVQGTAGELYPVAQPIFEFKYSAVA